MVGFTCRAVAGWLACLAMVSSAMADTAALLADVVEAHGGGVAPRAIHERGVTESLRRGSGPVERWWQAPDRFRIDLRYPGAEESRVLRGTQAWQQGKPASVPFQAAVVLQAARMALPWRLKEDVGRVLDRGAERNADGKPVRILEWSLPDNLKLIVEIDPATRQILRSRGIMSMGGSTMEFATRYEDYRPVAGRLIAFVERHYAMGQFIGTTTLESVEFPDVLPEKVFVPPPPEVVAGNHGAGIL